MFQSLQIINVQKVGKTCLLGIFIFGSYMIHHRSYNGSRRIMVQNNMQPVKLYSSKVFWQRQPAEGRALVNPIDFSI
jgi:hypothetical protein